MKTIYKTPAGREAVLRLYDAQLKKLGRPYADLYVDTSFGKTHLVETGNPSGPPLLIFHGGNSTTAYNLLLCKFLLEDFHVFAVDIVGHPGKSAERSLSPRGYAYGKWAAEVIDGLGFSKIRCFGGSFGGGVLAKLMCVSPEKIERSVLVVPSGVHNALPVGSARMLIPLLKYLRTGKDAYVTEAALFMAITKDVLDADTLDTVKNSFAHVKTKVGMPSNVSGKRMRRPRPRHGRRARLPLPRPKGSQKGAGHPARLRRLRAAGQRPYAYPDRGGKGYNRPLPPGRGTKRITTLDPCGFAGSQIDFVCRSNPHINLSS